MRRLIVALAALAAISLCAQVAPVSQTVTTTYNVAAPSAPTAVLAGAGAGLCDNGAHTFKIAYVTANGTTAASSASGAVTVTDNTTNGKIAVTVVASSNAVVKSINIYMSDVASTGYYLAASGVANSNGATNISIADATLITKAAAPAADTSGVDTVIYPASPYGFYQVIIRNNDTTNAVFLTLDGSTVNTTSSFSVAANCTPKCEEVFYSSPNCPIKSVHLRSPSTSAGCAVVCWGSSR